MSEITTNVFATANTEQAAIAALLATALPTASADGVVFNWKVADTSEIKYARAWLICRRAWLELHAKHLLVSLPAVGTLSKAEWLRKVSPVIVGLRNQGCSWGEIMCRTGQSEGIVRSAFKATGNRKDIGLRVGHGGRFAYDEPTLYLEHRKSEGAHIPVALKGRPTVAQLLNGETRTAPAVKVAKASKAKATVAAAAPAVVHPAGSRPAKRAAAAVAKSA